MVTPITTYEQYLAALEAELSWAERTLDKLSGTDERMDLLNRLTIDSVNVLKLILQSMAGSGGDGTPFPTNMLVKTTNLDTVAHGQVTITTAGTAIRMPPIPIPEGFAVTILAKPANTGTIYLGKTKEDAENASVRFDGLAAGLAISLRINKLNEIWVNTDTNGDGISWIMEVVG